MCRFLGDVSQIDGLGPDVEAAGAQAREVQEIADEAFEAPALGEDERRRLVRVDDAFTDAFGEALARPRPGSSARG